jgi:hypothetical protein
MRVARAAQKGDNSPQERVGSVRQVCPRVLRLSVVPPARINLDKGGVREIPFYGNSAGVSRGIRRRGRENSRPFR